MARKLSDRAKGARNKAESPSVSELATGKRAKLRRRSLQDYKQPETHGPDSKVASLLMFGMPGGGATKKAAQFGPKGFKAAKRGAESVGKHVMRVIKPILSKSARKPK